MSETLRLDQQILAETREVKKRQRARRAGVKPGPGRPDFTEIGGTRPTTSPLPNIMKSKSSATLGSKSIKGGLKGSKSTIGIGGGTLGAKTELKKEEKIIDDEESTGDKYVDRVHQLQLEVRRTRDTYNSLRETHRKMQRELKTLRDRLVNLKREDDVEENRRLGMDAINRQRAELDAAKKALEDTLKYRETLIFMCTRLKEQRLTYDTTIGAYEEALQVRREEAAEVRSMAVEVRMAKAREERELAKSKHLVQQEKIRWENQLEDRRVVARKREEQKAILEEKKRLERERQAEEKKEEQKNDRMSKNSGAGQKGTGQQLSEIREKLDFFQKTFQEIRLATGLSNVDDIVERLNQREHYGEEMQNEIDKKRLKTEQLNARKTELLKKMEAVKFSGSGSTEFNRDMIDKLSRDQDELHRRLKVVREEHERVEKVILEIRQATAAMAIKLEHIDIDTPVSPNAARSPSRGKTDEGKVSFDAGPGTHSGGVEATVQQIQLIETRLTRLMEVLDEGAEAGHRRPQDESGKDADAPKTDLNSIMDELIANNKHNVRVRPSTPRNAEHLLLRGAGLSPDRHANKKPQPQQGSRPTTADKVAGSKGGRDNRDAGGKTRRPAVASD